MEPGLHLVMTAALAVTAPVCAWTQPGANPYRGDPVRALADFRMPGETRRKLGEMMRAHQSTDVAVITRDDIQGRQDYTEMREMHVGRGHLCHGPVDRSTWTPDRRERALVYCADDTCVIVPTICNNVSLVTRRPQSVAALPPDEGPIDIAPAAGPLALPDLPVAAPPVDVPGPVAIDLLPLPEEGGGGYPGLPGGAPPCCTGPDLPGLPLAPVIPPPAPPPSAVPETPAGFAWLAGLPALWLASRRRAASQSEPRTPER